MPWTSEHMKWLVDTNRTLTTFDGKQISVFEFKPRCDDTILRAWAKHFRNHYCLDSQIDALRNKTNLSRREYLLQIKFPDEKMTPGPSIRSGDFAEVLIADYVEYVLGYWVPRTRYVDKTIRNESTKGADIIGFKIVGNGQSRADTLILFESKAKLTGETSPDNPENKLEQAVNGSAKDQLRKAESLNAIKQRLLDTARYNEVATVERFQNQADYPFTEKYGAAAVLHDGAFAPCLLFLTDLSRHPHKDNLSLVVIEGKNLMNLAHALYKKAADEA